MKYSKLSNGKYVINSSSSTTKTYLIEIRGETYTCSCIGYRHRGNCKHISFIRELNGEQPLPAAEKMSSPYTFLEKYENIIKTRLDEVVKEHLSW